MGFEERDPVIIIGGRHQGRTGVLSSWDGKYWCVAQAAGLLFFCKPEDMQLISISDLAPCARKLLDPEIVDRINVQDQESTYKPFSDLKVILEKSRNK